jgi:hypothetical protein
VLMLDLFAGLGGASAAMKARGWDVVTVDNDPAFGCTHTADLSNWSWPGPRPDLVWASPPCTEFSREMMPWCRTGKPPSLELVRAAVRVIQETDPVWWVLENVRGAVKWLRPVLGEHAQSVGPFYLWGRFPPLRCRYQKRHKESMSSSWKAERARVPVELSEALAVACASSLFNLETT